MTQFQLAIALSMDPGQLSKWERGELQRPSNELAHRVAAALDLSIVDVGLSMAGIFPPAFHAREESGLDVPLDFTADEWTRITVFAQTIRKRRGE